ncbi:26959_t:CDS:2, partial [Racocetra persica]
MKYSIVIIVLALLFAFVNARSHMEEKNPDLKKLEKYDTGDGDINGHLGDLQGVCIDSLLADAPPCSLQEKCDQIIDVAYFLGGKKKKDLIKLARSIVQSEKNTPFDGQHSVICKKLPRHCELKGLHFKQDNN